MTFVDILFRGSSVDRGGITDGRRILSKATQWQLLSALSVFCISFLCGMAMTLSAAILQLFMRSDSPIIMTTDDVTRLGTTLIVGRLAGNAFCAIFIDKASRRNFLLIAVLTQGVAWALLGAASLMEQLFFCQLLLGVGVALFDIIGYTYLAEITTPRNRAIFISLSLFLYAAGMEAQFLAELFKNYQILCAISFLIAVGATAATYYTLESPYHLIMIRKEHHALQNLSVLYTGRSSDEIQSRLDELRRYADEESNEVDCCRFVKSKHDLAVCVFVSAVSSAIYAGGQWPFLTYGPVILKPFAGELDIVLIMNLLGVAMLIGASVSTGLIDVITRRSLLLGGYNLLAVLQLLLSGLLYLQDIGTSVVLPQTIVLVVFALSVVCMLTVYPTMHVLRAELFPHAVKIRGNAVLEICKLSTEFGTNVSFFPIAERFGVGFNYLLYAAIAALAAGYVFMYYKETKNLTLREIRGQYRGAHSQRAPCS